MKVIETMKAAGEPLSIVDIPEGKYCPGCGRSLRVHIPASWLDRARLLKKYVDSGRVVFKKDVIRELTYLRRELRWVDFNRWQERRDDIEWARALAWVRADRSGVEAELLDTIGLQVPPRSGETESEYIARLRAYRVFLRRLGESDDAFMLREQRREP